MHQWFIDLGCPMAMNSGDVRGIQPVDAPGQIGMILGVGGSRMTITETTFIQGILLITVINKIRGGRR
jgi:hypothetical protein